jgi:predicted TIM-barrel fold metal-dependent hydrolase
VVEKIDAFCHVMPRPYRDRLFALPTTAAAANIRRRISKIPSLVDMDLRFTQMDEFGDYRQVINICAPPPEDLGPPETSRTMARVGNEALADLVARHPDRFAGFMACLPMDDTAAAIAEAEYACKQLGALGVQIYTHVHGHPMDDDRFEPFYRKMAELDALIQVHPCRSSTWPDYPAEQHSKYEIWWVFGWEYDLSAFMSRIVFGGVLERHPTLRFLIHHGGSMVPHFAGRVGPGWDQLGERTPDDQRELIEGHPLTKRPLDYFKMFYADTALFGAGHALRCVIDFFGAERVLFGSDSPFDPERGPGYIRSTIRNLDEIGLTDAERAAIFNGNVRRLLKL